MLIKVQTLRELVKYTLQGEQFDLRNVNVRRARVNGEAVIIAEATNKQVAMRIIEPDVPSDEYPTPRHGDPIDETGVEWALIPREVIDTLPKPGKGAQQRVMIGAGEMFYSDHGVRETRIPLGVESFERSRWPDIERVLPLTMPEKDSFSVDALLLADVLKTCVHNAPAPSKGALPWVRFYPAQEASKPHHVNKPHLIDRFSDGIRVQAAVMGIAK